MGWLAEGGRIPDESGSRVWGEANMGPTMPTARRPVATEWIWLPNASAIRRSTISTRCIALDPQRGHIYWSAAGADGISRREFVIRTKCRAVPFAVENGSSVYSKLLAERVNSGTPSRTIAFREDGPSIHQRSACVTLIPATRSTALRNAVERVDQRSVSWCSMGSATVETARNTPS
jgi:hypothetical protein